MDTDTCPDCGADLQTVGVRKHGLASFEANLVWNEEAELYEMNPDEEPTFTYLSYGSYACIGCGGGLSFNPDDRYDE